MIVFIICILQLNLLKQNISKVITAATTASRGIFYTLRERPWPESEIGLVIVEDHEAGGE